MAIKGFTAVLAALVVVAGGMASNAYAGKGEVRQLKTPEEACSKYTVGTPRYDTCITNKTENLAIRQEEVKNKSLAKCDMLSPKNAKACKCAIDPALPICSASLS